MVTRTANNYIYDNFKIGIAEVPDVPGEERFIHLTFSEQDFPDPALNPAHIFKIHEKQLDAYIEMLKEQVGKKHVHIATPGDMPHGPHVR